jgi:hypothetical protein
MAESSFPVLEQPLTDQQWGQVTAGLGSGVLGSSSGNYALVGVSNATNTAQLSAGGGMSQAIVSGYYHRIDANHSISLPAISSGTVTYYVGLTYDPLRHAEPTGPVSITVTTSKPSGGGKVYLPLYEVPRQPNELLTDAIKKVRVRRVLIAPTLSVAAIEELPDPETMMQGTLCQTSNLNMIWRVSGDRWVPLNATGILSPFAMGGWRIVIPAGGIELTYLEDGRRLAKISNAQIVRTGAEFTQGTSYQAMGTLIPDSLRGAGAAQSQATLAVAAATYPGAVRLDAGSGVIQFRLATGSQTIMPDHVVLFSASWIVAG